MLIRVSLPTNEPVALTDEPPVFCRLTGELPLVGVMKAESYSGGKTDIEAEPCTSVTEAPAGICWPSGAWLLELDEEEWQVWRKCGQKAAETARINAEWLCGEMPFLDLAYLMRVADRFYGRPWRIAETGRLIIREMCPDDAEMLMQMYQEEQIRRYVELLPETVAEVREMIAAYVHYMYELNGFGIWVLAEKNGGRLIGRAGIEPESEGEGFALGYLLADFARGKGYAEEACRAVLEYAQRELCIPQKEIRCHIAPDNLASRKLAEKLGVKICLG